MALGQLGGRDGHNRSKKGGSRAQLQARVRLTRDGELIHKESKTFSTKTAAKAWAQNREVQLKDPKVLAAAKAGDITLAALIRWYVDTFESISPWQRSKQCALEFLEGHPIGQTDPLTLTADVLIDHVRQRRLSGLCPSTVWNDLCWIRVVLDAAKTAKNLPFPLDAIDEARKYCVKHRLIARSKRRERRPTNEELQKLDEFSRSRSSPMHRRTNATDHLVRGLFGSPRVRDLPARMGGQ